MKQFKVQVYSSGSNEEYNFECYKNTVEIGIGEYFLFFFGGIADVGRCTSESEKSEINKHERSKREDVIDFTHNFWTKCYKIKDTNFDYKALSI